MSTKAGFSVDSAHEDGIWSVDWKADRIITGSMDGRCKLWTLKSGSSSSSSSSGGGIEHVATSATKCDMGVQSVVLLPNGRGGVGCSQDGKIGIFDESLNAAGTINAGMMQAWSLALSQDGEVIASGNQSGQINIWASESRELNAKLDTNGAFISSLTFDMNGTRLATSHMDGWVRIFDLTTQQVTLEVKAHHLPARQVCFSPDNQLVYSCSDDRHVCVFDVKSASPVNSFSHSGMALSVDASVNGRHFLVGCADKQCLLWDLGMQRSIARLNERHTDQVWGVKFSPDGKNAVSVGDDALMVTYDIA